MTCGRKIGPYDCCTVVCGDCLELMKALPDGSVDAVITDPPYGNGDKSRYGRSELGHRTIVGDQSPETYLAALPLIFKVTAPSSVNLLFSGWRAYPEIGAGITLAGFRIKGVAVWDKTVPGLGSGLRDQHEFIVIANKGTAVDLGEGGNVLRYCRLCGERPAHPNEKPIDLLMELVAMVPGAGPILDPFLGSGTTAVAAKKLGRHFLGFEISEEYCRIARERIALVEAQPSLFEKPPEQLSLARHG